MTNPQTTPSHEHALPNPRSGIAMLILAILVLLATPALIACAVNEVLGLGPLFGVATPFALITAILMFCSLTLVNPNHAAVLVLFGRYTGTIRKAGFFAVNPFTVRKKVSLRIHNFTSDKLKVNDLRGNPIEIGTVVVWRVNETAQAMFDVEDFESYVALQSESAIRTITAMHPYDTPKDGESSLRGSADLVNAELKEQLTERLSLAGIEVLEVRISHLAYAPEIAGSMLRRQQAEAVIDARTRIVEGAVSMVQMAIDKLQEHDVIELDEERKAAMVSNLLVVLCGDHDAQPVVNAGTLYN